MTRTITFGLALAGLAALSQSATANSCFPQQHHAYIHSAHYQRVSRIRRHEHYVVLERPRYRSVYEEVYEPVMAPPPYAEAYWAGPAYTSYAYDDEPYWHADYSGGW